MSLLHPDLEAACQLVQRLALAGDRAFEAATGLPPERACGLIRLGLACHRLADHASRRLLTPLPGSLPTYLPAHMTALPAHVTAELRAPAAAG